MSEERSLDGGVEPVVLSRALALEKCSFLPGSFDKRFSRDIASAVRANASLTPRQVETINRLAYKYRRQMPADLVPARSP